MSAEPAARSPSRATSEMEPLPSDQMPVLFVLLTPSPAILPVKATWPAEFKTAPFSRL